MIWDRLLRSVGEYWGAPRSSQWRSVRSRNLKSNPHCSACGTMRELEVHHIVPFHVDLSRELDPDNLLTLCDGCHFYLGHLRDWTRWNPHVREDAAVLLKRFSQLP